MTESDEWEYQTVFLGEPASSEAEGPRLDQELTRLGKEGWELVAVVPNRTGPGVGGRRGDTKTFTEYYRLFFKRRKGSRQHSNSVQAARSSPADSEPTLLTIGDFRHVLQERQVVLLVYSPADWVGRHFTIDYSCPIDKAGIFYRQMAVKPGGAPAFSTQQ